MAQRFIVGKQQKCLFKLYNWNFNLHLYLHPETFFCIFFCTFGSVFLHLFCISSHNIIFLTLLIIEYSIERGNSYRIVFLHLINYNVNNSKLLFIYSNIIDCLLDNRFLNIIRDSLYYINLLLDKIVELQSRFNYCSGHNYCSTLYIS